MVVALELLGGDFANKVEDVAKDVKKLHAMQAIRSDDFFEVWHLLHTLVRVAPVRAANIAIIIGTN